jgi:hypothetical protein
LIPVPIIRDFCALDVSNVLGRRKRFQGTKQ